MIYVILVIIIIVVSECCFRVWYKAKFKRPYHVTIKFKWDENHVSPHPFLTFAYKKNHIINKNQKLPYPLHTNKFTSYSKPLYINNRGHFGPDVENNSDSCTLRIACLGHSTTANNLGYLENDYTYPDMLGQKLNKELKKNIYDKYTHAEIMNCGIGGWTSIDIMIDFCINILPLKPQYIVYFAGYNDLYMLMQDNVAFDYTHVRKSLGEVLSHIKIGYFFPKISFLHFYEFTRCTLFGSGNIRNEVLRNVITNKPIPRVVFDYSIEENAISNICILCKYYGIKMILCSTPYYNFKNCEPYNSFCENIKRENVVFQDISKKFDTHFVDIAKNIAYIDENFVDEVHFSPQGMDFLSEQVKNTILSDFDNTKITII